MNNHIPVLSFDDLLRFLTPLPEAQGVIWFSDSSVQEPRANA